MPDDTATSATDVATEAARVDILAAIQATAEGPVGHGTIRLLDAADLAPAAIEEQQAAEAADPAAAAPERAGHGTIRLRGTA
jgi:hypothetical protein